MAFQVIISTDFDSQGEYFWQCSFAEPMTQFFLAVEEEYISRKHRKHFVFQQLKKPVNR